MSYFNSSHSSYSSSDTADHLFLLPDLCPVPAELEVPELVISPGAYHTDNFFTRAGYHGNDSYTQPHHHGKDSYKRTILPSKSCPSAAAPTPYSLPDRNQQSEGVAPWRQTAHEESGDSNLQQTAPKKQSRRKKTVFSPEELAILTMFYEQNKYLNPESKAEILTKIDVPGNVLVMWFQNRRAKERANGIVI